MLAGDYYMRMKLGNSLNPVLFLNRKKATNLNKSSDQMNGPIKIIKQASGSSANINNRFDVVICMYENYKHSKQITAVEKIKSNKGTDFSKVTLAGLAHYAGMTIDHSSNNPLTVREMTCLILLANGKNPDQCADLLGISKSSVTTYEQRLREKLGAKNRTHALYLAVSYGYIKLTKAVA